MHGRWIFFVQVQKLSEHFVMTAWSGQFFSQIHLSHISLLKPEDIGHNAVITRHIRDQYFAVSFCPMKSVGPELFSNVYNISQNEKRKTKKGVEIALQTLIFAVPVAANFSSNVNARVLNLFAHTELCLGSNNRFHAVCSCAIVTFADCVPAILCISECECLPEYSAEFTQCQS